MAVLLPHGQFRHLLIMRQYYLLSLASSACILRCFPLCCFPLCCGSYGIQLFPTLLSPPLPPGSYLTLTPTLKPYLCHRYVQGLFSLATDASPAVRKAVCTGLVQLLSLSAGSLEANLHSVIEYMLASTQDPDEGVAVEACEFWSEYPESGLDLDALKPFLPRILLVLLGNMVWDEYDEEVAEAEAAEEEGLSGGTPERDRDSDVKPAHVGGLHAAGGAMGGEGYEEGDEDDEDDGGGVWNLRRCSAAGLDVLASSFGNEVLPLLLPTVQARLAEPDWRTRESGILALGAVSEGCGGELAAHLPGIVAALLPAMRDPRPLVRCIACWTLTRYGRWLVDRATQGQRAEVDALVEGLCERVGDHNRKVQEAACSSVAAFAEESGDAVMPYAGQVLTALAGAVQRYGRRTLRNAYDAIATLAENCPAAVASPQAAALVLQPMFGRLAALRSGDRDVLPLLECFAAVAPAVAAHMEPYAVDLFSRCMGLVDSMRAGAASGAIDKEEADEFTVGALDAISGLAEGLGAGIEPLIGRSALVEVLVSCAGDPSADVRQSAFALIGDLARACGPHLRPVMNELVAAALTSLQPVNITQATMSVCNNAAWALGEMAVAGLPEQAAQYALPVLQCLLQILSVPAGGLPRGLVENAAIALGRFAWVAADALAPNGAAFMGPLCSALRGVRDGTEKEHAFLGLCSVLRLNPDCGAGAFTPLCEAVVSWRSLPCDGLSNELSHIMRAYKEQLVGMGQWEEAMAALSPAASQKLIETCHLG